jgi:hypothetical protein
VRLAGEETKALEFKLPEGWVNTMSDEDHSAVVDGWCIDDPTLDVAYELHLATEGHDYRIENLTWTSSTQRSLSSEGVCSSYRRAKVEVVG